AGHDLRRLQIAEKIATRDASTRATARRPGPEIPFDSGVVEPEHGIGGEDERGEKQKRAVLQDCGEGEQRNAHVIGPALPQAELAGLIAEHVLEIEGRQKSGGRDGCGSEARGAERRHQKAYFTTAKPPTSAIRKSM